MYLSVIVPLRWLAGNTHKLAHRNWGERSMGKALDLLHEAFVKIRSDPSLLLKETFIMNIFKPLYAQLPELKDYLNYYREEGENRGKWREKRKTVTFRGAPPLFGEGSYGQISRLVPEHLHIMQTQFQLMTTNDAWQLIPKFQPFIKAFEGLRELGKETKVGKEFYVKTTYNFFLHFDKTLQKQIKHWKEPEVTWMAVAGHPMVAKLVMRKIANDESAPADLEVPMHHHYM
eukprot:scaffold77601_cov18-Cyclotella_meneghiniana.AAC.1